MYIERLLIIKQSIVAQILIIYTRYLLGATFVFSSFIKMKGRRFTSSSGEAEPIASAFHFFETLYQSGLYWQFIGLVQFVSGALLMTQKYAKIGALMYFPIILNVFIITLSYYFAYTYVITGLMLLASIALILWDFNELGILIDLPAVVIDSNKVEKEAIWIITGTSLLLYTSLYRILNDQYNIILWFLISIVIAIVGFVFWWHSRRVKHV